MKKLTGLLILLLAGVAPASAQADLKVAELGACALESGRSIENCLLTYRTFGQLNAARSNAVLFPTWFGGTTDNLVRFVGPEGYVDSTQFFVILVDAFGSGLASSPSNSPAQPGPSFPAFTIRDMVNAEYRLVTEHFRLPSLHAVMGISMGGMQAFQWAFSYPQFVEKGVSIVGTPRLAAYDVLLWVTQLGALEIAGSDEERQRMAMVTADRIHSLATQTPGRVSERPVDEYTRGLKDRAASSGEEDPYDRASQLRAMLSHDIYAPFDRMEDINEVLQTEMLIVVGEQDHMVNPGPSKQFAEITGATLLAFDSPCGHTVFSCESEEIGQAVSAFLRE